MAPRFLIIGAGGLVGRHLRAALAGRNVACTYRSASESRDLSLDITDEAATRRTIRQLRPGIVLLAAADAYVERCEREADMTRRVNVVAAGWIAAEAAAIGALLVVFSSEYVFDGTAGEYSEQDDRHPLNEYGRQKVDLENIVLRTGRSLVCRTSGVFGEDPRLRNFVCQLVERLRSGAEFAVAADQLITPTYAPSLAAAVIELVSAGHTGVFHVAGPTILSRVEFARMIANAFGLPNHLIRAVPTSDLGLAATRPLRAGLSVEKLTRTLGHGLAQPARGLREMAEAASRHDYSEPSQA